MKRWLSGGLIALSAIAVTSLFFLDICNLFFQCGCTHLWAGAAAHCNIHNPTGKHCPWCSVGQVGYGLIYAGIVIPQTFLSFFPRRWNLLARLAAALAAFPIIGALQALVLGLVYGYWT